jgi:hypothetical protein
MAEPIGAFEQEFVNLSHDAKRIVLSNNPEFKSMSREAQDIVINKYTEQFKPPASPTNQPKPNSPTENPLVQAYRKVGRPGIEMLGMAGGALVGGTAGTFGAGPVGTAIGGVAGAGLGAAGTSKALDVFEETVGLKKPSTFKQAVTSTGKDFVAGAEGEMLGPIVNKGIGLVGKGVSRVGREILGNTTGAGRGSVEGAIEGGKSFTDAMRGKISGEDIANNARSAAQAIRDKRAMNYQTRLKQIDANQQPIDTTPIFNKTVQLMDNFNVKITPKGAVDVSRVKMGETGKRDIEKIIKRVYDHGSQVGDNTASGLDGLKRELDDFYSESSQARAFVSALRKEVHNTISKNVKGYDEMTKEYAKATNLLKDIESGLMLRKNAMSGRVTADNTLRRLTSAMRENFEMRRDLLEVLGNESGTDIAQQVAGYQMNQALPHGLIGKLGAGGALFYSNPKMWPLVAAASPRVVGEFLNVFGKSKRFAQPATDVIKETAKRITAPSIYNALKDQGGTE